VAFYLHLDALVFNGTIYGLKHFHHISSLDTTADGTLPACHAIEEMPALVLQRFSRLDPRTDDISVADFEAELGMAQTNKQLFPELETIFLMSKAEYSFISSSTVKEIARLGGDVSDFVPAPVNDYLKQHFSRGTR